MAKCEKLAVGGFEQDETAKHTQKLFKLQKY